MSEHGLEVGQLWVGEDYWTTSENVRCVIRLSREAGEDEFEDPPGSSVLVVHHAPLALLLDAFEEKFSESSELIERERAWFPRDGSGFVNSHTLIGRIAIDRLPGVIFLGRGVTGR